MQVHLEIPEDQYNSIVLKKIGGVYHAYVRYTGIEGPIEPKTIYSNVLVGFDSTNQKYCFGPSMLEE